LDVEDMSRDDGRGGGEEAAARAAALWISSLVSKGQSRLLRLSCQLGLDILWTASPRELVARGMSMTAAEGVVEHRRRFDVCAMEERLRRKNVWFVTYGQEYYPHVLVGLAKPPVGLYLKGEHSVWEAILALPRVTIVGTRRSSGYGCSIAQALGQMFSRAGVSVISGMARGIDGRAHAGALRGDTPTVGVLGAGPDIVYPRNHAHLYREVGDRGVLVSEYPPGTPAARWTFPARNRIMAALGDAVIVVEAGERSGALLTVDEGLELNRPIFAVPGPVGSAGSLGTNRLAAEGAFIIYDIEQAVEDYATQTRTERRERKSEVRCGDGGRRPLPEGAVERLVLQALSNGPRSIDEVAAAVGCSTRESAAALSVLELDGAVNRCSVGVYGLPP